MSHNSILEEAIQKLERLRKMPSTPMREREIISLERLIASGAKPLQPARAPRKSAVRKSKAEASLDDDSNQDENESPSKPLREVENLGEHRRIHIRKEKPPTFSQTDEDEELKKEGKQRLSDIQSTLGLKYRGFS